MKRITVDTTAEIQRHRTDTRCVLPVYRTDYKHGCVATDDCGWPNGTPIYYEAWRNSHHHHQTDLEALPCA